MGRFLSLPLALFLLLTSVTAFAADQISDDSIYDKVRIGLANDRDVGGVSIEVKVTNGIVELTGKVKTEKQKNKTEKVAKKVKGVKSVVNNLTLAPE